MEQRKVAYGINRKDKDFRNLGVPLEKIFIDNKNTREVERQTMFATLGPGVTLVVLSMSDLGHGAGLKRLKDAILATGATIEGPKDRPDLLPKTSGPRGTGMTPDQVDWACALWLDPMRSEASVRARIKEDLKIQVNRDQMNYLCRRKPRRKSAKK